jgi:aminoglycoside N3'-acetyltransferase
MNRLTERDIERALADVIGPDDDVVALFSGIWTFGHRFAWPAKETPDRLLEVLDQYIGPRRTLIIPTYTFAYARTRRFDPVRSCPEVGVLAQRAVHRPGMRRTLRPMFSYAVKGPHSDEILGLHCTTAWGDDGIFGWLEAVDARICVLGVPWHVACSFYHRAEEICQVPYRYYKRFPGVLVDGDRNLGPCAEVFYACSLNVVPKRDYSVLRPLFDRGDTIRTGSNPDVPIESANATAINQAGVQLLTRDGYALISNREAVETWVRHGKAEEVAALKPEERWPG